MQDVMSVKKQKKSEILYMAIIRNRTLLPNVCDWHRMASFRPHCRSRFSVLHKSTKGSRLEV